MKATRIYELGTAHCRDMTRAEKIIEAIAKYDPNGWFKIQYYESAHDLCTRDAIFKSGLNQIDVANKYKLGRRLAESLLLYARSHGLKAGATFYTDFKELPFEVDFIKIASPDCVDQTLLKSAYTTPEGIPIIISTGGATINEIQTLAWFVNLYCLQNDYASKTKPHPTSLLYCIPQYPQPEHFIGKDYVHARHLFGTCAEYRFTPGYSDHSFGSNWHNTVRIMAAMGASVFEKHIQLPNTVHIDSGVCMRAIKSDIQDFIRITEDPTHTDYTLEDKHACNPDMLYTRKYWVCTKDIPAGVGNRLTKDNVTLKRCMTEHLAWKHKDSRMSLFDGQSDIMGLIHVTKTPIKKGELITSTNTERNK